MIDQNPYSSIVLCHLGYPFSWFRDSLLQKYRQKYREKRTTPANTTYQPTI